MNKISHLRVLSIKDSDNKQLGAISIKRTRLSGKALITLIFLTLTFGTNKELAAQESIPAAIVKTTSDSTFRKSGYVAVGRLKMYYEIHGKGQPLVLLHGGLMYLSSWGATLTKLAQSHEVIAFDMEGHGRTADLDRPLTWEQITDDVSAAIKILGYNKVDVMGYSLGGVIALRMGMKYPSLVQKLVVVSGIYSSNGYYPTIQSHWPTAQQLAGTPMEEEYAKVAPNPAHWSIFVEKIRTELTNFKGWSASEVRNIKAPTLIIFGDNDAVLPEYEVQLFRMLGGDKAMGGFAGPLKNQMAVLPNTTHFEIFKKADLLVPIVNPFLDAVISN